MTSIRDELEQATKTAAVLHAETETLNEKLMSVCTYLAQLNIGVSASVLLAEPDTRLWFTRGRSSWWLAVTTGSEEPTAIQHASRDLRVLAVDKLPELIVSLRAQTRASLDAVSAAITRLDAIIKELAT